MRFSSGLATGLSLLAVVDAAPKACHLKSKMSAQPYAPEAAYSGKPAYDNEGSYAASYSHSGPYSALKSATSSFKPKASYGANSGHSVSGDHEGYNGRDANSKSPSTLSVSVGPSHATHESNSGKPTSSASSAYEHVSLPSGRPSLGFGSASHSASRASGVLSSSSVSFHTRSSASHSTSARPSATTSSASSASSSASTKTFSWPKATSWVDWKTYKSNGVNVGSWLEQEFNQDTTFWAETAADYADEWSWCEGVGFDVCGPILEDRYANWITEALIDKLAATDINTLRIPVTYAAFYRVPGSWLYSGNQLQHLKRIMNYAIEQYDMHIVLGLHSLPGGYNTLQIGEAFGHNSWWHNQTLLDYTYKAVDGALDFIVSTGHKDRITFSPFNEASDNFAGFGSPAGMTSSGQEWLLTYVDGVVSRIAAIDSRIPLLFQDCFMGMEAWSSQLESRYGAGANIVISSHNYWFAAAGAYSNWLDPAICGQAAFNPGDGKFPVFIGEWSLQTMYNNTLDGRQNLFDRQRWAFQHYTSGGTFWTAKFNGLDAVDGEGTQRDYWSYERLIDSGVVSPMPANSSYCD